MDDIQLENRLTKIEEAIGHIGEDVKDIKASQKDNTELAIAMNSLTIKVGQLSDTMADVIGRLTKIEMKPARRWEALAASIISLLVAGVGGFLLGKLIGG
jgi:hypothetical protein